MAEHGGESTGDALNADPSAPAALKVSRIPAPAALILPLLLLHYFWYSCIWRNRPPVASEMPNDILSYYLPNILFSIEELRAGRWPLWNPYEFLGMPMFGTLEYGPLYPPQWLYFFFTPADALLLIVLLHCLLLFFGFLWLGRQLLRLDLPAAICGAFALLMSGPVLSRILNFPNEIHALVWLPLAMVLVDRIIVSPARRPAAALGLVMALQFLAGDPEITVRTVQLLAVFMAFRWWAYRKETGVGALPLRQAAYVAGAALLSLGLVMLQLLPALEVSAHSNRSAEGLSFAQAFSGGMPAADLLQRLFLGLGAGRDEWFLSPLVLPFALYALVRGAGALGQARSRALPLFFAIAAAITFELVRGDHSTVAWIYYHLPGGGLFRWPERFLPLLTLFSAALFALGAGACFSDLQSPRAAARNFAAGFLLATGVVWLLLFSVFDAAHFLYAGIALLMTSAGSMLARAQTARRATAAGAAASLVVALMLPVYIAFDFQRFKIPPKPNLTGLPEGPRQFLLEHLQEGERFYADYGVQTARRVPKVGTVLRLEAVNGFSPFMPDAFWNAAREYRSERLRFDKALEREKGFVPVGLWGGLSFEGGAAEFFRLCGVRFALLGPGTEIFYPEPGLPTDQTLPPGFKEVYRDDNYAILECLDPLPRAFVIDSPAPDSLKDLLDILERKAYTPAQVDIAPREVRATVPGGKTGTLVLLDQDYPGWTAEVQGEPASVEPVAGLFRAVRFNTGQDVVFRYRPACIYLGGALTGLSVLVLLCICLWPGGRTNQLEHAPEGTPNQHEH